MQTKPIYYQDSYKTKLNCKVISVTPSGNFLNVILDQTIFYPEGGGQPSDRGKLGETRVEYVRIINDEIIHQIKGNVEEGVTVEASLDWDWRYKYMKIHSAGHLLHDVLMTMTKNLKPLRGSHGKKAFLEYQGEINSSIKKQLELEVNKIAQQGLEIITKFVTYDELAKDCQFLPLNLPKNKPLRMIKIGNFPPMPDGGVHLKNTKEIGTIYIPLIEVQRGITRIRYGIAGG
jgi:Predicted metal-dependent hydrolases related to alanyl-tRNA synthetase HxxxH domain